MSWKVHETDEVFAGLRGLCSNVYRMYDPSEYRSYYDHDCETYECAVEDAAQEYERLLKHCEKQREELAAIKNPLGRLKGAFMDNIDGGTEVERIEGSSKVRAGSSITDELRECIATAVWQYENDTKTAYIPKDKLTAIADRIDAEHAKAVERARMDGMDATFGSGWVKLPVDADGVPIHVGDELTDGKVARLLICDDAEENSVYVYESPHVIKQIYCYEVVHRKPDSWEGIISDAVILGRQLEWLDNSRGDAGSERELVERCRRLAGERG